MSKGSRKFRWVAVAALPLLVGSIATVASAQAAASQAARPGVGNAVTQVTVVGCVLKDDSVSLATGAGPDRGSAQTMQLTLSGAAISAPAYSLTGIREADLAEHVGRRVELTGTVEQARIGGPAAASPTTVGVGATAASKAAGAASKGTPPGGSATGVTPQGATAHEPGDAAPGTIATDGPNTGVGAPAAGAAPGSAAALGTLPRINVTSFRRVDGSCLRIAEQTPVRPIAPATTSAVQTQASAPVSSSGSAARATQPVTIVGCLVRQTPAGAAHTAHGADRDPGALVLTRAALVNPRPATVASAVPGSRPSGGGTGTVETTASAARNAPIGSEEKAFVVSAPGAGLDAQLAGYIGKRVEVVGMVSDPAAKPASETRGTSGTEPGTQRSAEPVPSSAHPSAPNQYVTITSVRPGAGSCQ